MNIGTKVVIAALGSVAATVIATMIVQKFVIEKQGVELTVATMRAAVIEAENVRESISELGRRGAFDRVKLLAEFKASGDLRSSTLYDTIPVVAAWEAIGKVAEQEGFEFRVPKNQARNSKNNPTAEEEVILKALESGAQQEYIRVDRTAKKIIFARPIKLTQDCLICHGDPATSPNKDGCDMLGFKMENWKVGEVHGAFLLKADLRRVDTVVWTGLKRSLTWVGPLTGIIGLGFYAMNRRMIVRPLLGSIASLRAASEQTAAASSQISAASQNLAEGASEQAATLEETSASLEEIASMTKSNTDTAGVAKSLANETRHSAETTAQEMEEMRRAMTDIKNSGSNIAAIVKTIDEIAFQTNILALNAAVEAARAGESGTGFAVVAEEVRALAQRSTTAARETADKIEDSIRKSNHGGVLCAKMAVSLGEIVTKIRRMDELVAQIAGASLEQNAGVDQVSTAMTQMDKVTQTNAAHAEETASASEQLRAQARETDCAVRDLVVLVGGKAVTNRNERSTALPYASELTSAPAPRVNSTRLDRVTTSRTTRCVPPVTRSRNQ